MIVDLSFNSLLVLPNRTSTPVPRCSVPRTLQKVYSHAFLDCCRTPYQTILKIQTFKVGGRENPGTNPTMLNGHPPTCAIVT